ncbi:MAG: hypothetical protein ACTSX2_13065 [Candidatus Thorarchaeota archaeon]
MPTMPSWFLSVYWCSLLPTQISSHEWLSLDLSHNYFISPPGIGPDPDSIEVLLSDSGREYPR